MGCLSEKFNQKASYQYEGFLFRLLIIISQIPYTRPGDNPYD